ncbi:NADPH:quinone reductase [Aquibium sp. A9E412]|uniref:NADPH:quinone reductase n=1 Tax=Aquibium sp. A9E412 TaxID=2976767 RepID=UPI0025B00189|nr:NADPH:quinone reductase [Aquibium sp. A9E412]MDN2565816.1 NADPH:quinone reductase [Aquibium sp. A9E412]
MKAAWYEKNGRAHDVLTVGEMDTPAPEAGEVLVRLHTSGVNPSDVKSRRGRPLAAPRIVPHSDGAGVIEAVGQGVARSRVGERVWLWNGQWKRPFGTAAEFIALPERQAVRLPDATSFDAGACLGIPALTAMHAVLLHEPVRERTVLVTGAGSAVGDYATQIAKARGARVLATASPARAELARKAGADFVIDYKTKDVAEVARSLTRGRGVDGIIDMDLSTTTDLISAGVLAPHGMLVGYGSNVAADVPVSFPALLWGSLTLRFFLVYDLGPDERARAVDALTALLQAGTLRHTIGARFRLDEIAAAHEAVEGGRVVGNVILEIA